MKAGGCDAIQGSAPCPEPTGIPAGPGTELDMVDGAQMTGSCLRAGLCNAGEENACVRTHQ